MVGDTVLLQCSAYKGKHKIQDQWENTIYEVIEQAFKKHTKLEHQNMNYSCRSCTYLGHVVSKDGIQTNPKMVEAICKRPIPTNVTEMRSFLGFTNLLWMVPKEICTGSRISIQIDIGRECIQKMQPYSVGLGVSNCL